MTRSETIGALGAALAKAQAAMKPAVKDAKNPHFKSSYADLASVWEACRAHLTANGIAVIQSPEADGARVTITTLLAHSSGEWLQGALTLTARQADPQSVGSAITYGRRYGLASMVGVAPDDDDAEAATGRDAPPLDTHRDMRDERPRAAAPSSDARPAPTGERGERVITEGQRKRFYAISKEKQWTEADVKTLLGQYGYASSKDIKAKDYDALVQALETGSVPEDDYPTDQEADAPFIADREDLPF